MGDDYGVRDLYRAAPALKAQLQEAIQELDRRRRDHGARMTELEGQRTELLGQMAHYLLPDLTRASTDRAGQTTALADLLHVTPQSRMESEREQLQADLAAVDADPTWQQRDIRRARAQTELDECQDYRRPLAEAIALAAHPRLERLLGNGYDTPAYDVGWWRASYYADWKAGDEILERFPHKASFSQVRDELVSARQAVAEYDSRIGELQGQLDQIARLEHHRAACADSLTNLEANHLALWQQRLVKHLDVVDPAGLADRLGGDASAELLLKTIVGLGKKREYLFELARTQLDPLDNQVRRDLSKLERDLRKYSRPKKSGTRFPAAKFQHRFRDRRPRYSKLWSRYDRTYSTIYVFDDYGRSSFYRDFLWWDLMTDGRIDGSFCREVRDFHQHHPHYRWDRSRLADEQAAAAVIAADRSDAVGAFDPS